MDGIKTEGINSHGETGIRWLTFIFQKAWEERCVPEDWQRAIVVPIWKRQGSNRNCTSYKGISLPSNVGKMYAKILELCTREIVEPYLSKAQFGFRKDRGCKDAIFVLCQLCVKAYEYQQQLQLIFIDQEKDFD